MSSSTGGPTIMQKLQMGGIMGGTVGLCIGFVFGTLQVIKYGPGPNGYLRTMGSAMGTSAATFGFFMAIGTAIRTDSPPSLQRPRLAHPRKLPIRIYSESPLCS